MWESTMAMPMRMTKITAGWGTLLPTRSTTSRSFCMPVFGAATAAGAALMRPPFREVGSLQNRRSLNRDPHGSIATKFTAVAMAVSNEAAWAHVQIGAGEIQRLPQGLAARGLATRPRTLA